VYFLHAHFGFTRLLLTVFFSDVSNTEFVELRLVD